MLSWDTEAASRLVCRRAFLKFLQQSQNESLGYNFAFKQAHAVHNQAAEQELAAIAPYPGPLAALTAQKVQTDRKWVTYFGGAEYGRTTVDYVDNLALLSPDYSQQEVAAVEDGEGFSAALLAPQLPGMDYESTTHFKCPVFLFEGRHDGTVPYSLAATWYETLTAPAKHLIWFENSAHMPMLEEPGHFLLHLVLDVRPLADEASTSHP
ncbi:MAG: hypothetical protein ACRYFU_22980 [Janthinobacterium lividum]